jgi:hypothetical protein
MIQSGITRPASTISSNSTLAIILALAEPDNNVVIFIVVASGPFPIIVTFSLLSEYFAV